MRASQPLALALVAVAALLAGACAPAPELPPLTLQELYLQAGPDLLQPTPEVEAQWRATLRRGWSGSQPELERLLEENAATLEVLHERVGAAHALGDISSAGHQPGLMEALRLCRLLLLEGRQHEHARRHDDALRSALLALRFAHRHLHEREVPLIVSMIGHGLQSEALRAIKHLVHRSRTTDAAWRSAMDEMASLRAAWPSLEPSARFDSATNLAAIEEKLGGAAPADDPEAQLVLEQVRLVSTQYTEMFITAYRDGRPDRLREELEERGRELESPASLLGMLVSDEKKARVTAEVVAVIAFTSLASAIESDMLNRLALSMERVAIAGRLFWFANGRRPMESLDELVPGYIEALPEDLFAPGLPVCLARQGKHWWIYSVGPDRVDDGGLQQYSAGNPEAGGDFLSVAEQHGSPHQ